MDPKNAADRIDAGLQMYLNTVIAEAKAEERDWLVSNFEQHVMSRLGPFEAAVVRDILKDLIRKRGNADP